ncbi:MAG: ribonuclease Y [Chrysiogenales bacterium]|nr:MAG: ribonuclease Y [Chrysiogenales bacterium]
MLIGIFFGILGILLGGVGVFLLKKKIFAGEYRKVEALRIQLEAKNQEEMVRSKKQTMLELKEEFADWKNEYNRKHNENINRLNVMEKRLIQKEENLDKRYSNLDNKEKELKKKERELDIQEEETAVLKNKVNKLYEEQRLKLEEISGLTVLEAKELIIKRYEGEARLESAQKLKQIDEELKSKSQQMAKDVISNAVQRIASEHVVSSSVTVIDLPSDEMKGRIIGREGRNIRALETATGVDFIVDDTPEAILVSSFDPIRREIAKQTIETLIADGRIHPARIEEIVERIKGNFDNYLRREGEHTVVELGLKDISPELFFYLGKLKFRSSFGQNVLEHSKDVAMIAAMLAREIGSNVNICKRAGLLHDVGKSIDRETEGTHTSLSVELARKYGESAAVQDAIASHHMDVEFNSIEAVLIQAADSISAARPGARREILETYIKRLEKLEEVSKSFSGVTKAYALQAGREIRVIINANELDDNHTFLICKDIARKIQDEMEYPGQIKVSVIREVRAIEYAK